MLCRNQKLSPLFGILLAGCGVFGSGKAGDPTTGSDPCAKPGDIRHSCGDGTCCPNDYYGAKRRVVSRTKP